MKIVSEKIKNIDYIMKKFVTYLLFSATTLHAIIGGSPVMALGCGSHSDKVETVCEVGDIECIDNSSPKTTKN